jgi:hypothetical protein
MVRRFQCQGSGRQQVPTKISVTLEPITSEQATNGQRLFLIPGRASKADDGTARKKAVMVRRVPVSGIGPTAGRSASSQGEADREGACKSMNHAQKYLSQANRQIAELTVQHARQRVIVKHALDTGQGSEMAESLLDALEGTLRIFEKHRIFLLSYSVNRPNRRLQRQI